MYLPLYVRRGEGGGKIEMMHVGFFSSRSTKPTFSKTRFTDKPSYTVLEFSQKEFEFGTRKIFFCIFYFAVVLSSVGQKKSVQVKVTRAEQEGG